MIIGTEPPKTIEVKFDETLEKVIKPKDFDTLFTKMQLRVCAYCRVSTDFEEQETSYKSQREHYENYIKTNPNWELVEVYADKGLTGTQLKNRDNFNRMIQDALNGKIDLIIAKSISRFARNTVDTLNIVRALKSHNVDVFFEKENIHTISITNELFLTLYSAFAQGESESISENMKAGLQYKMLRGEPVGHVKCYGYNYIDDPLNKGQKIFVIIEEEAKIVVRIFEEYAKGYGTTLIAKGLNLDKIPSPTGKIWKPETIRRILFNEKYVGDLCCGKTFGESVLTHKRKINKGESKQYYTTNHHIAIISRELWDKAHEMYKKRSDKSKQFRDKYSRRYAFSSKIYCACCGERFVRKSYLQNKRKPNGKRVVYWGCRSRNHGIECKNRINYYEEELQAMFVKSYNQLFKNKDKYMQTFINKVNNVLKNDSNINEKGKLEKERKKILDKQLKLIDLKISVNNISKEALEIKLTELDEELKNIDEKLRNIENNERKREDSSKLLKKIIKVLEEKQELKEFDEDVFESIVERVIIGEEREDGSFDYEKVKFILKTGDIMNGEPILKTLNATLTTPENKSSYNVSIKKIEENKNIGLTAYMQIKRLYVCNLTRILDNYRK